MSFKKYYDVLTKFFLEMCSGREESTDDFPGNHDVTVKSGAPKQHCAVWSPAFTASASG